MPILTGDPKFCKFHMGMTIGSVAWRLPRHEPWRAAFPAHAAFFDAIITKMEKELAEIRAMRVAAQPVESSRVARL